MKNTLETRLGIFFALALIAAFIILEMLGGAKFLKRGYRVHGLFRNVQELKIGDPVKLAGVQIGQVEKIALTNNEVNVTMKINRDAEVKTDSKATIKFTGLMGQNFVSIDFGTGGVKVVDDAYLQTAEQPDLSALMAKLDNVASGVENLTKSFTGDKIDNLLGPFTDFLKENSPRLTAIIGNMQTISSQIAEGKGTVGKLINDESLLKNVKLSLQKLDKATEGLEDTGPLSVLGTAVNSLF